MYSRAQRTPAPPLPSWSSSLPQLESHLALSSGRSRTPPGGAVVEFSVPESAGASLLAVSEFSALLTFVSPGNRNTTLALWDLESGTVVHHRVEGESALVRPCGERQHRLLLKSKN